MPKPRNTFKLGLAMLLFLALFVSVLVFIAGGLLGPTRSVVVRFPDGTLLPPLAAGSEVRYGSTVVGHVASLRLHRQDLGEAAATQAASGGRQLMYFEIVLEVDAEVDLREDCRITAVLPIIGSTGHVLIQARGTSANVLADGATVAGRPPASVDQLTQRLVDISDLVAYELDAKNPGALLARIKGQLDGTQKDSLLGKVHTSLSDLNRITASVADQLDAGERATLLAKLHALLDTVNQTTASLSTQLDRDRDGGVAAKVHAALDAVNTGLRDAAALIRDSRQPVQNTLASVEAAARRLDQEITKPVGEQLDVANPVSLLAKIHLAVGRINSSLEDLNAITSATRTTIDLNLDRIDRLVGNFQEGSDHLRAGLKDLRYNPWRLLYTPSPNESKQENILSAARDFAEAATRLDGAIARLKALAESRRSGIPSDDPQLGEIRAALTQTFRTFTQAEQALWRELDVE